MRTLSTLFAAAALIAVAAMTTLAQSAPPADASGGPALGGYCPVAYAMMNQAMKGNPQHKSVHEAKTYHFANAGIRLAPAGADRGAAWGAPRAGRRPGADACVSVGDPRSPLGHRHGVYGGGTHQTTASCSGASDLAARRRASCGGGDRRRDGAHGVDRARAMAGRIDDGIHRLLMTG